MFDFLRKLLYRKRKTEPEAIKEEILKEKEEMANNLHTLNKQFKLILEKGEIEIVIRNLHGVVKELK